MLIVDSVHYDAVVASPPVEQVQRWDVHSHVVPPLPDFAERYGDRRWPTFSHQNGIGQLIRDGQVVRTLTETAWSVDQRIADITDAGIDRQVISPVPPLMCDWADGATAAEWCRQLNTGIAQFAAASGGQLLGLGMLPLQDPIRAVEVLTEARDMGLRGVQIATSARGRELDDPALLDVFAAAAEQNMLVFVHPLMVGSRADWTDRISGTEVTFGLGMTTDTAIAAAKLVFGGVMQACPHLSVCLAHGGGTFAWALPRIRRLWERTHDTPVSALLSGVYVDSLVFAPANLHYLRAELGADRILFGSDFPLPGGDSLDGQLLSVFDAADRDAVLGANAARLLGEL